jgi:hypothetical protein
MGKKMAVQILKKTADLEHAELDGLVAAEGEDTL